MPDKKLFIGIDLGGTNIKAALVDTETGEITATRSTPTRAREGHDAVIAEMAALSEEIVSASKLSKADVGGVGVGIPGALDLDRGMTVFLPNLPGNWRNVSVRDQLAQLTGLPVAILNDARSMTLGEWKFGAGRGVDIACYTLGTGIGGGLVINGKLHLGGKGSAGELGHVSVDLNGPRCGCGSFGCIEAYASGPAIAAMGMKAVVQGRNTIIAEMCENDLNRITPELICEAARSGDEAAREIYEFAGKVIGAGVANVIMAVTPRRIVIGGGVAAAGDLIIDPIRRSMRARVFMVDSLQVEVVQALLGNNAGLIGAALWAREMISNERR
jgi:glucokinase